MAPKVQSAANPSESPADLIPVQVTRDGKHTTVRVDARTLHKALGVGKTFAAWLPNRIKEYGFTEGKEFFPVLEKTSGKSGGRHRIDYLLTLGMAKELAMVERSDVGQRVRRYFIDLEERVARGDVTLAAEIAERASPEKVEWLARRTAGIAARKDLTSTLHRHGVHGKGYADCTNAIYVNVLGAKKSAVVAQRGLPAGSNLRDHMDAEQLVATAMAEIVARKRIVRGDAQGNERCAAECYGASSSVMQLMR